jgi:outer membrane protein assembly factor BamB
MKFLTGIMIFLFVTIDLIALGGAKPDFFISNNKAYICDSSSVYCIDIQSGEPVWKFTPRLHTAINESYKDYNYTDIYGFIVSNGQVIINTGEGYIVSLNPDNGTIIWEKAVNKIFRTQPVAKDDQLFFGAADSAVYAFNLSTKEIQWNFKPGGEITNSLLVSDYLYFGTNIPFFHAVNIKDGQKEWVSRKLSGVPRSTPVLYKGHIFLGCVDGSIYNIDAGNGGNYYWIEFPNRTEEIDPVVYNDQLVFKGSKDVLGIYSIKRLEGVSGMKIEDFEPRSLITRDSSILYVDGGTLKTWDVPAGYAYNIAEIGVGAMSVPVIQGNYYYYTLPGSLVRINLDTREKKVVSDFNSIRSKCDMSDADDANLQEVFKNVAYPDSALKENIQGQVTIRCLLNEEGKVIAQYVHFCSNDIFLKPSQEAISKSNFNPVVIGEKKVVRWVNFSFNFILN